MRMIVEDRSGGSGGEDGHWDRFPVGMRVLAVDDDRTCLKILENLLHQCHYHVTSTTQAITALEMLRENRNKFDLVISDVSMPDMDGFKLLELVGLEMDLPVIMLSTHSDTELVMKGIAHGAVDYLVKPVRIQELKNIWQHVVRKKKFESRDQIKASNQDNARRKTGEIEQGTTSTGRGDRSRKRKDQSEDEYEEGEEGNENDDPSNQKKARVVWSVELHRKFVAAVNQIGIERSVPKKILELMDVEGLSRENVASHLQKYRLYLKRIASKQEEVDATFGSKDRSFMHMHSLEGGFGDFRASTSFQSGPMLARLNSPSAITLNGLGNPQPPNTSRYSIGNNQFTRSKSLTGDFNRGNDPTFFGAASSFPSTRTASASTLLQGNQGSIFDVRGHEANFARQSSYLGNNAVRAATTRVEESRGDMQCQPWHHYNLGNSFVASMDQNAATGSRRADFEQLQRDASRAKSRANEDFLEQMKSENGVTQNNYESLDDIMRAIIKQEQNNQGTLMDGEYWA